MRGQRELSDAQWELIEPILRPKRRADGRGRPWQDTRCVLDGVLWVLGTGAQWRELPGKCPPYQTCQRRFQQWVCSGKLEQAVRLLAGHLWIKGQLNLEEAFVDATLAGAKEVASPSARPVAARAQKFSLSPLLTVFHSRYLFRVLPELPARLIGDRVYDSDALDQRLKEEYDNELIAPHRGQRRVRSQGGRKLRRYNRRWRVERLFAWPHWFRRLVTGCLCTSRLLDAAAQTPQRCKMLISTGVARYDHSNLQCWS
jgi:transposase